MVPSCRGASTLKVTVPGATPSLLHFVPSGRSTTNLQSPPNGWASTAQPVLSAMGAQSGPQGGTTQVESRPGPFGMNVAPKSPAAPAGLAKPTAAPAAMAAASSPVAAFRLASLLGRG